MGREDWDFVKDKSGEFVSILQCNNAASSRTPRGHQFPAAFMMQVAGFDKHMLSISPSSTVILTLLEVPEIFQIQQLEPLFLPLSSGSWDRKFTLAMVL